VFPSDLPGVNPATLNEMILYCRFMTKWSGLGDSTELSRVGLSQFLGNPRFDLLDYLMYWKFLYSLGLHALFNSILIMISVNIMALKFRNYLVI
jgi:hypothetical protein